MGQAQGAFLMTAIETLKSLHDQSVERGETMLAFLLDLAKTEAEDQARQAGLDAHTRTVLRQTSIIGFLGHVGSTPPQAAPVSRLKRSNGDAGRARRPSG
jgi:hypothetical protein